MRLPLPDPPSPFLALPRGSSLFWVRPQALERVEALLEPGSTLHAAAEQEAVDRKRGPLHGRGPVHLIPGGTDGDRWAVRHFHRGGLLAPLTGDRYLRSWGLPRPLAELRASEICRERGVPTPRVMAAAIYGRGLVYRGDLATCYIPHSTTLARLLLPGEAGYDRRLEGLKLAGHLARRLAEAGILHADLNVKNLLLDTSEEELEGHILDLDRVRIRPPGRAERGAFMLRRLQRSLRKWESRSGHRLGAEGWAALEEGWAGED